MALDLERKWKVDGVPRRGWVAQAWLKHVARCAFCGVAGTGQHGEGCVVLKERARARHIVEQLFSNDWKGNEALRLIDSGGWS